MAKQEDPTTTFAATDHTNHNDSSSGGWVYANHHIPDFLALPGTDHDTAADGVLQIVHDGSLVTAANVRSNDGHGLSMHRPMLILDTPESIGMTLPSLPCRRGSISGSDSNGTTITVRDIADIVGHMQPVHVMDVEYQEDLDGWTFGDLVEYFEDEERLAFVRRGDDRVEHGMNVGSPTSSSSLRQQSSSDKNDTTTTSTTTTACPTTTVTSGTRCRPPRRKASVAFLNKTRHRVLNQISFEFSNTELRKFVQSPQLVRDLDWIDQVWPNKWRHEKSVFPNVQYYCLTSAAGSFTDFHVDFGGTAVWYHVLQGQKQFVLIPPTDDNLKIYEQWLCHKEQANIFLPTLFPKAHTSPPLQKVTVHQKQTLLIPSGWIHAVYTPQDSLVFGGNFLHGLDMHWQLNIHNLEVRTRVLEKFRFPWFVSTQFYAAAYYLQQMRRLGPDCEQTVVFAQQELDELPCIIDTLEGWWKAEVANFQSFHAEDGNKETMIRRSEQSEKPTVLVAAIESSRSCGCTSVDEFLSQLRHEHTRVQQTGLPTTTMASPATKMKIKIPLSNHPLLSTVNPSTSPKSPRVRLKVSSSTTSNSNPRGQKSSPSSSPFRIHLLASSQQTSPIPKSLLSNHQKKTPPREDMASFVDEKEVLKDDEWLPSPSPRPKKSPSSSGLARKRKSTTVQQRRSNAQIRPGAKATTARQRLLKKAKW